MARPVDDDPPPAPAPPPAKTAQWFHDNVNSDISVAQWQEWLDEGRYKDGKWKSRKTMYGTGEPAPDSSDHPDACPPGTAAFGETQCRAHGAWMLGPSAQAPASPVAAPPVAPPKPRTLQDVLLAQFKGRNLRTGLPNLFAAWRSARQPLEIGKSFEGLPLPLPESDIDFRDLPGGGVISALKGTNLAELGAALPSGPPVPAAPAPTPAVPTVQAPVPPEIPPQAPQPGEPPRLSPYELGEMEGDIVFNQPFMPDLQEILSGKRRQKGRWFGNWF